MSSSPTREGLKAVMSFNHSLRRSSNDSLNHGYSPSQLLPLNDRLPGPYHRLDVPDRVSSAKPQNLAYEQPPRDPRAISDHIDHTATRSDTLSSSSHVRLKPEHEAAQRDRLYMSRPDSGTPPSIFDHNDDLGHDEEDMAEQYTNPTQLTSRNTSGDEAPGSYDLKPPPPSVALANIELLAQRLFSIDHLKMILRDNAQFTRFNSFLTKYRPDAAQSLKRYMDTQKAISAVDYANAIADQLAPGSIAAMLEETFETHTRAAVDDLVNDALPGYVTHRLVQIVTETLVKEITGQNTPIMRELVANLAEVYCLTDPSMPDNPIVYASEEFYRTTQYGRDYVIGRNCRFLQGPKSSGASVQRLIDALADGQEICETILNYRRDGSPFMNLLMIAPLYDNKGAVRYFIGAQIDVNGLIEGGRGLDSFERVLAQDRADARFGEHGDHTVKSPEKALSEMSAMWTQGEMDIVRGSGKTARIGGESGASTPVVKPHNTNRRVFGMDDSSDKNLWPAPSLGPSGRLPGVFQNYLLVRPYPSLRITFTSPALRIPGLLQSKFLDRIGGPTHIRDGILSALSSGIGVTAKIQWLTESTSSSQQQRQQPAGVLATPLSQSRSGGQYGGHSDSQARNGYTNSGAVNSLAQSQRTPQSRPQTSNGYPSPQATGGVQESADNGRTSRQRWIHCTPLLGSDDKVGVWMVVMVESESITGAINHDRLASIGANSQSLGVGGGGGGGAARDVGTPKFAGGKLYNEYLRREGRHDSMIVPPSAVEARNGVAGSVAARSQTSQVSRQMDRPRGPVVTLRETHERVTSRQQVRERAAVGEDTFRDF